MTPQHDTDLAFRVGELERRLRNVLRPAKVVEVDAAAARVRVDFGLADDEPAPSGPLPWLAPAAGGVRVWRAPSVGEQVMVLSPGGEAYPAVALPGIFCDDFPAPETDGRLAAAVFPDGSRVGFDEAGPTLAIEAAEGTAVEITAAEGVTVTGDMTVTGDVTVDGGLEVTGDIEAEGDVADENGNMGEMRTAYNAHGHPPLATSPPNRRMT